MLIYDQLPDVIASPFPPCIIEMPSGRYLIGGPKWYKVPSHFTLQDADLRWSRPWRPKLVQSRTVQVANSKGTGFYQVSIGPAGSSCTCTGFGYRRTCKHVDKLLSESA